MKKIKEQAAFTLIEMMIVLFVISILLLITIPNVTSQHASISEKGCEGLINMVQGEVQAYWIDHSKKPESITDLTDGDYLKEAPICPDGTKIIIDEDGNAVKETES
ncbi:competence type IV pilus major pilin ComGC [Perspicuibacillus lycopersici]|uniref:competence type IV pilus major pilin ComGC n=1 Tax=Perspicuibacillus lycopersici TaxID=1325689 RepID=UPI002952D1CD|nr:competence type IV pilus major pilin ComGC [Perspicuibacillus lycopersici]